MCTHRKSFHSKQALYSYYTPQINEELIILVSICQKHAQYAINKTCFDYSGHYKWSLYLQLVMLLALYGLLSKILPPSEVFWVMRARFFSFLDDYYGSVCVVDTLTSGAVRLSSLSYCSSRPRKYSGSTILKLCSNILVFMYILIYIYYYYVFL